MSFTIPNTPARVRIAPSPTGDPHVGTAYIALFNKALAVRTGGQFILRVEDTDRARFVQGSEDMIFETLRWLGLDYDEGPDVGGSCGPYRQSERTEIYRKAADELLEQGTAYRCFCTAERLSELRASQRRQKMPTGYDGRCRAYTKEEVDEQLAAGTPFVVRLSVPKEGQTTFTDGLRGPIVFDNSTVDDQVLLKSDNHPTYHLANVVDDHAMGITHVIRAEEWITSTPKHVLLYQAFGWDLPQFVHMPLLRNKDKSKISKRKNPVSLNWYREQGYLPEALRNFLGLLGHSMPEDREFFPLEDFFADFNPKQLKTSGPVFDLQKLEWLNGEWIRSIGRDDFIGRILESYGERYTREQVESVAELIQERIRTLAEWPTYADTFFFGCPEYDTALLMPKKVDAQGARAVLETTIALVEQGLRFEDKELEGRCREEAGTLGLKIGGYFMVLRVAVTGTKVSPPLFESMAVLGREETLVRLRAALARLAALAV